MNLSGKKILLGITGGIAAYKTPQLVRLLVKQGAQVRVVMTPDAHHFVTPLALATVSRNPVLTDFYGTDGEWNNHVELALWADLILIAPLTANTLAKMAQGQCDNLLLAIYLSAKSPVMLAPAMDLDMYQHPVVRINIETLKAFGHHVIPAASGELASGLSGEGRMPEPEELLQQVLHHFLSKNTLQGKRIMLTAGPTYEAIDPVRFIGNHSSGKMGIALADELALRGASVTLVCGPSMIKSSHPSVKRIDVISANEMYKAAVEAFKDSDAAILAAAVADYMPESVSSTKIKKSEDKMTLQLVKTPDILASLGKMKTKKQVLVGFALETNDEEKHAIEKLKKKNLDFIVLNSLNDPGAGFKHDTNKISIIDRNFKVIRFGLKSKSQVAADIADYLETVLKNVQK
ncbi:MAG: bifunctional phosphopantothenoylcysteine decarboxylase/phosphopantothenate--cysteine ligase CoaBC [Flavobacteriales bacterium]|nr:bifunctional phosphopantothenoylcysteine decarboxylase/phosphopantothenate--cysteine ligase CoaBC [Flavobacteriales bacterium]